ncbi:MAG: hypothetical protein J5813_07670 [Candidatus Methanomethylophilaceae archaeon]|nr:hypothetical protein [Candidatus Methanomethylophilaceae archaeon]
MEVRIIFTDSEFRSIQKCASEEGVDVPAFIRGAALELVKDIEDFKAFKEDMERNPDKYSITHSIEEVYRDLCSKS